MARPGHPGHHPGVTVELVTAEVVRPLRHEVLRLGWPDEESHYAGDDDPRSAHAAARDTGSDQVVAVGTVLHEAAPWEPASPAWRLRGMATAADQRGHGLGSLVLDALIHHVRRHGGGVVWCNARVKATTFYQRAGFVSRGELFDLPGIGVHQQMWRSFEV